MAQYKVKVGETTMDVDGLAGLVKLVRAGQLKPDDPVFVPSTSRWHYARSIRQLREHFGEGDAVPEPPRQPAATRVSAPLATEPPRAPRVARVTTNVSADRGEGDDNVVPLRRGKWTPDGKGVEVPVFAYDVDLEPPAAFKNLRAMVLMGMGLLAVLLFWVYLHGYRSYLEEELPEKAPGSGAPMPAFTQPRIAATPRTMPTPHAASTHVAAATPVPTATPPLYDSAAALQQVRALTPAPVTRVDQLGAAMKSDLLKLTVPAHAVTVSTMKAHVSPAPFRIDVDYAPGDVGAASRAKHRFLIVAYVGRRVSELKLNAGAFDLVTEAPKKKKPHVVSVPIDLAEKVAAGTASATDVDALFTGS